MTFRPGHDGRLNFANQSDAELKARRAELVREGQAIVARKDKGLTGADVERAGQVISHAKSIDAELAGRAERRSGGGGGGDARRIDHENGTIGGSHFGVGESKGGYLTTAALKAASESLADKVATAREGKSLTAAGGTEVHVVDPGLSPLGRPNSVLDVVKVIGASAPQIRFMKQTSRTNNAAVVPAGETKPTSTYGVVPVDRTRKVLAHLSEPIQEYDIQDVPALMDFVHTELNYGLVRALELGAVER